MKNRISIVAAAALAAMAIQVFAGSMWETDFQKASDVAKKCNRYLLLNFCVSDYDADSMVLETDVYEKKPFRVYAEQNLVCVYVDFPQFKRLDDTVSAQNKELAAKHSVKDYPTVIILSPAGDEIGRAGKADGTSDEYVAILKGIIEPHRKQNKVLLPKALPPPSKTVPLLAPKTVTKEPAAPIAKTSGTEPAALPDAGQRMWTSKSGTSVAASYAGESGAYVQLKKEDGSPLKIMKADLSDADIDYITGLLKKDDTPPPVPPAIEAPAALQNAL